MNTAKIFIALLCMPLLTIAQSKDPWTKIEKRQNRTTYRGISYTGLRMEVLGTLPPRRLPTQVCRLCPEDLKLV